MQSVLRPACGSVLMPSLGSARAAATGGQWAAALPSLRAFITANYNQPNPHNQSVMPSPPTVTALAGAQAEVVTSYDFNAPEVFCSGGYVHTNSGYRYFPAATWPGTGQGIPGLTNITGNMWRATTRADAANVWIRVSGSGGINYRFIVDGRYVDLNGTLSNNTQSIRYFKLAFGSKAVRTISIEATMHLGFHSFGVAAGDSCSAPVVNARRMAIAGDSITRGSSATYSADGFAAVAGDMLGFSDLYASGVSETGYVADGPSNNLLPLPGRLGDINSHGPWDAIVIAMGVNDLAESGVQAAAEACIASFRVNNPASQLFVLGPWDSAAPSAPSANFTTTKNAISAAVTANGGAGSGVYFLDTQGVTYAKADAIHPNTAGSKTLGDWLALQIKTTVGA